MSPLPKGTVTLPPLTPEEVRRITGDHPVKDSREWYLRNVARAQGARPGMGPPDMLNGLESRP